MTALIIKGDRLIRCHLIQVRLHMIIFCKHKAACVKQLCSNNFNTTLYALRCLGTTTWTKLVETRNNNHTKKDTPVAISILNHGLIFRYPRSNVGSIGGGGGGEGGGAYRRKFETLMNMTFDSRMI